MKKPHKGASSSSGSPRTPRNQRGGRRAGAGARPGNLNGARSLPWLESYDLGSSDGIASFMRELVKAGWTGTLGSRSIGALNGSLRLLLEHLSLPSLEKRIEELEKREVKS
jgi:hypothetical protein